MSYLVLNDKSLPANTLVISKNSKLLKDIVKKLSAKSVVNVESASDLITETTDSSKEAS